MERHRQNRQLTLVDPAIVHEQIVELFKLHPDLAKDEDFRADVIEGETDAFEVLERLSDIILQEVYFQDGINERIKDLETRRYRSENRQAACKRLAEQIMQVADLLKAQLKEVTVYLAPSPPRVVITDAAALPEPFWRHPPPEPNKMLIKEAIQQGQPVPGAALSNQPATLRIRTK